MRSLANTADTRGRDHQSRQSDQQWNQNRESEQYSALRQDQLGGRGYQGKCQICGAHGHRARRCFQLLNRQLPSSNRSSGIAYPLWQPRATMALSATQPDTMWLMDTGATHNMTNDLQNLSLHQPYHGNNMV